MLVSHGLVYQRRLEAIRRVRATQWHKWPRKDVPGCLEGRPSSGERGDTWPSQDDATWTNTWMCSWVDMWDKAPTGATSLIYKIVSNMLVFT